MRLEKKWHQWLREAVKSSIFGDTQNLTGHSSKQLCTCTDEELAVSRGPLEALYNILQQNGLFHLHLKYQ